MVPPCTVAWLVLSALVRPQELPDDGAQTQDVGAELRKVQARLDELERSRAAQVPPSGAIDLSDERVPSIGISGQDHVLARPWFENVRMSGYAAVDYLDTGDVGTAPEGSFLVKEASLFLDTELWKDTSLFTEIVLARFPGTGGVRVGELYLQFTGLFAPEGERGLGAKFGRFEIPFGEEYFRWDAHETPFVTFSAADPYGVDEGAQLYGRVWGVDWIAAITAGSDGSGADDDSAKLWAGKISGAPLRDLYLSASVLTTGDSAASALRLSGNPLSPVGTGGSSALGASPSRFVDSTCWELDARLFQHRRAMLALGLGGAEIDDLDPFARTLTWWQVLPSVDLTHDLELLLRYSAIATDDSDEGYRFSGKPIAKGEDLGYDAHSLRRLSSALCWTVNDHVTAKLEVGQDWFDLIGASPLDEENDERFFAALELVGHF